ncbi:MAG: hypothetical protein IPJ74_24740 [Saprospiraceae bacterium]|nr:hypothetical protein [Saprospiraceae bacterium]
MIDALADNQKIGPGYEEEYRQYVTDKRRLENLIHRNEASSKEVNFCTFN